jgi:hypothetical protein
MWYHNSFLASKGRLCCLGFGSVLIDQVYLGSVINLGLVGDFIISLDKMGAIKL